MVINMKATLPLEQRQRLAEPALAGLMTMARLKGDPSAKALAAVAGVRDHLMHVDLDLSSLPSLSPQELAQRIRAVNPDPQWRERVLRGMTLVALFDGAATGAELALLEQTAQAFEVAHSPVDSYRRVMGNRQTMVRLDLMRRSFLKDAISATVQQEGAGGVLGIAMVLAGQEDKAMAARYQSLRSYPEGSFGRAYANFISRNQFNFPGELGGPPPPVMHHDCCHVLGGYGTTAAEEGAVIGFQAGFEKLDPFDVLMFVIAEFEVGIGVSPFIPGEFNQLDPERIFAGMAHGSQVTIDLIAELNPWDHFASPLAEVRQLFNVVPRGREAEYPTLVDQ